MLRTIGFKVDAFNQRNASKFGDLIYKQIILYHKRKFRLPELPGLSCSNIQFYSLTKFPKTRQLNPI